MTTPTSPTTSPTDPTAPPTRLTARSPEDLVAAAAVVLGFWPTESLVVLTFGARPAFHARIDLPGDPDDPDDPGDPGDPGEVGETARSLVEPAVRHGAERVAVLVFSRGAKRAQVSWRALRAELARHRIEVVEALLVGDDRWWRLPFDDEAPGGSAREATAAADTVGAVGVPLDRRALAAHPFLAQAVVDGLVLHASRAELAASLRPDPAGVARVESALAALPADRPVRASALRTEGTWAHDLVRHHAATAPGTGGLVDADVARLLRSLQTTRVRDAVWSALTRDQARGSVELLADVVRRAPGRLVAAPAALLAWAAWQSGHGALAWCAVERCHEADPDEGLAALVAEVLERAVPPTALAAGFDWTAGLDEAGSGAAG